MNEYILTDDEIHACKQALEVLVKTKGVVSCITASPDGFAIAEAGQISEKTNRLAAMSSSASAVANALVHELNFEQLNAQIIDATEGKIVVMSLPTPKQELALLCTCKSDALIGQVLYSAKRAAKEILDYFNGQTD